MKKQIFSKDFSSVCNANNSSLIVNKELLCWPFEQRAVSNDQRRIQNPIKYLIAFCGNSQRLRGVRLGKDVLYKEEEQQSRFFWNRAHSYCSFASLKSCESCEIFKSSFFAEHHLWLLLYCEFTVSGESLLEHILIWDMFYFV